VEVVIDGPNPTALGDSRWEAHLLADGDSAVLWANGGVWSVCVDPRADPRGGAAVLRRPDGGSLPVAAADVIDRARAFAELAAWLVGREGRDTGLRWQAVRTRRPE
jgi:hypothetical protein